MPVVIYRQPWFWAVIVAVVAVMVFGVVIAASGPRETASTDSTTIVQPQPTPQAPEVTPVPVPVPVPSTPPPVTIPPPVTTPAPPPVSVTPAPAPAPAPAPKPRTPSLSDVLATTSLPRELKFNDADFRAATIMKISKADTELKTIGTAEDSTLLYASANAREPYLSVLVPLPDKPDHFIKYERR